MATFITAPTDSVKEILATLAFGLGVGVVPVRDLACLFNDLSETRVPFNKLTHGVRLTEWIIKNSPSDFHEMAQQLKAILANRRE